VGAFLHSRWVEPPAGVEERDAGELAPGFRAAGVACGIKGGGTPDLGLLLCDEPEPGSAALLTSNAAPAAPVRVCRERAELGALRAVVASSGNANAGTGPEGYERAVAMQEEAAAQLDLAPASVAVASTGQIGIPLPIDAVREGISMAAGEIAPGRSTELARAIMTTDRAPKHGTLRAGGVTISAQAKGAGMIQPGFATALCFVQTDATVPDPEATLRAAAATSFERITVDGLQSTNDTIVLQATGAAGSELPAGLLDAILLQLALDVVEDGEGATRVARLRVGGAGDDAEADRVARTIANSQLVQTALHGRDANWGRIVQAAGMALAGQELKLDADSVEAAEMGADSQEADLALELGRGEGEALVYFSDLSCDYVRINSDYSS